MSLSEQARHYMAKRDELSDQETALLNLTFDSLYTDAKTLQVPAAIDDRAAELEVAIVKFIIESREG